MNFKLLEKNRRLEFKPSIKMKKLKAFIFIGILLICTTCLTKPEFDQIPSIDFVGISKETFRTVDGFGDSTFRDQITIRIRIQDGDGDLGLDPADTLAPYQTLNDDGSFNEFSKNYFVKLYTLEGEDFVLFEFPSPQFDLSSRFKRLNEEDDFGPLEVDLNYDFFVGNQSNLINKVARFEVQIADRALNKSNVITTDTIRINTN